MKKALVLLVVWTAFCATAAIRMELAKTVHFRVSGAGVQNVWTCASDDFNAGRHVSPSRAGLGWSSHLADDETAAGAAPPCGYAVVCASTGSNMPTGGVCAVTGHLVTK